MTVAVSIPGPGSAMSEILAAFPGAQRTLFRHFHIGGCCSCAFRPQETLADLCARNGGLDPQDVLAQIKAGHEEDARILMEPKELAEALKQDPGIRLVDIRSREEFDAVRIDGSALLSQPVMREILSETGNSRTLVIIDHQGKKGLDAAAYFLGQGVARVRCLRGGIDAWAQEVDSKLRRYRVG